MSGKKGLQDLRRTSVKSAPVALTASLGKKRYPDQQMVIEQCGLRLSVSVMTDQPCQQSQLDRQMIRRFADRIVGRHIQPPQQSLHVIDRCLE